MKLSVTLAGITVALLVASGASAHRVVPVLSEVRPGLGGARGWARGPGAARGGGSRSAGSFSLLPPSAGAGLEALARLDEAERAEVLVRRRLGLFHGGVGHSDLVLPLGGEGEILAIVDASEGLVLVAGSPVDPASLGGSSLVVRRAAQEVPGTLSLYGGGGGAGDVQGYEGRLLVWRPDDPGAYLPAEYSIEANLALADPAGHPIHGPPSGLTYLHTGQSDVIWSAPTDTPILTASAVGNDRYFHARPWIDSIALYDYRARFYDPATSTFLELDPLGPVDSPNLYQAFGFDGLNVRDPWGLHEFRKVKIGDQEYEIAAPTLEELEAGDLTIHWSYQRGNRTVQIDVDQRSALTWALLAKESPGSVYESSWEEFYGRSASAIPHSALGLYWKSLKANAVPIALSVLGEALAVGDEAVVARPGARSGTPKINLLNNKIPTNSAAAALTRSGLPARGVSTSSANTAIVPYDPEFAARNSSASWSIDYYVRPNGEAVPGTFYRYASSRFQPLADARSGLLPSKRGGTYVSFDRIDDAIVAKGKLQLPYRPDYRVSGRTIDVIERIAIPRGEWGRASYLEPIVQAYPKWGPGKATQAVITGEVPVDPDTIFKLP